jgi:hypothetical protein
MKLCSICFGILMLTLHFSWAQYDSTYIYKDFNVDGITDTLLKFYSGGSGYGGYYVGVQNGANDEVYEMDSDGCFCQIRQTFKIPENLTQKENAGFLTAITSEFLPTYRVKPDPSLSWMLAAELSNTRLESDSLFIQVIDPNQPWITGGIEIPDNYYIEMNDHLLGLYQHEHAASGYSELMVDRGYMVYYASTHKGFEMNDFKVSTDSETYEIYKTKHGIIAKKGEVYKWLFVTDVFVTSSPEKLRWASIGNIRIIGKHILFEQHLSPQLYAPIHVINIETGKFGRFRRLIDMAIDPFNTETDSISFTGDAGEIKHSFKAIFAALDASATG